MSNELQAARDKAVAAIADWLAIYGDEVGGEADRLHNETNSPIEALKFVLEKGQDAVLEARNIVSEGFVQASQVVESRHRHPSNQPTLTDEQVDAEVKRLRTDPDTWVLDDVPAPTKLDEAVAEASEWVALTEDEDPTE